MMVTGDRQIVPLSIPTPATPSPETSPAPDVPGGVLGAAFRQDNLAVNAWEWMTAEPVNAGVNAAIVDPFAQIKGTEYEQRATNFAGLHTQAEVDAEKEAIDKENADRRYLAESGVAGIGASLLAGVLDPTVLIPGAGAVKGGAFLANAARVGITAGIGAAATEAGLQSLQSTRTGMDSAMAIGGTVVLGGLLGGVAGKLMGSGAAPEALAEFSRAGKAFEEMQKLTPEVALSRTADDMGAAAARAAEITDFDLPTRAAQWVHQNTPKWATINQRLQTSQSPAARDASARLLATDHLAFEGTDDLNLGASVERQASVLVDQFQISTRRTFNEALRKSGMSREDFNVALAGAMRRGDQHANPVVADAAKAMRREVFDPLKDRAIKAGLLPEDVDVTTAASYFSRKWKREAIIQNSNEFTRRLTADFKIQGYGDYAEDVAREVYDTLTGNASASDPFKIVVKARGPFKERTLNVKDVNYEDFLDNDFLNVTDGHARTIVADTLLKEHFGDQTLAEQLRAIRSDYADLRKGVTDAKALTKLQDEERRVLEQFEAARDMLRGNYGANYNGTNMARVQQTLMTWNYVRALGGMTVSAIPDMARGIMTAGLMPAMREGFVPLMRGITRTANAQSKASRVALREAAGISEALLSSRMFAIAELNDPLSGRGPVSAFMHNVLAPAASKYSGMNLWNDVLKESVVAMAANRTARMAKAAALEGDDMTFLRQSNMNQTTWRRVSDMLNKHGRWVSGDTFDPGVSSWPEPLRLEYLSLLRSEADKAIVSPSIGDKNFYIKRYPGLAFATQFKSFMLASHARTMISGLQGDRLRFAQYVLTATTLGMMTYAIKQVSAGRDITDNPGTWIAEGLDRSGTIPMVFELNNTVEKFGLPGIYLGLGSLGGDTSARASRYASRAAVDALVGPTGGLINDAFNATAAPLAAALNPNETVNPNSANSARNLLPFGRHPGVQQLLDWYILPASREALGGTPQ